jgi:hypothetical protein
MRTSVTITSGAALLLIGYLLGASNVLSPAALFAQAAKARNKPSAESAAASGLSDETKTKIKAAADALKTAKEALEAEGRYPNSAIKGINSFTVLTGGGDSQEDLKKGTGVDPETFAALYAGLASDTVIVDLGRDPDGKLTYKGRVVRMYPVSAIRAGYARRSEITGEDLLPTTAETGKTKAPKKEATEETTDQ